MSDFFDTSVLLAAFCADDPRHEASIQAIAIAADAALAAQSVPELYAALTQLPPAATPPPQAVALYIESLLARMPAISLSDAETAETVRRCATQGASGAALYNALQLRTAEKAGASRFFTWDAEGCKSLPSTLAVLTPDHA